MRRSTARIVLGVTLATALIVSACGRGDDDNGADTTDTTAAGGEVQPGPGFDGETITLGALTPTSGVAAVIGGPLTRGNEVFIERVNDEGGVAGKYKLALSVKDTEYRPQTALTQYQDSKRDVVMFAQILGTDIVNALLGALDEDGIMGGPATLDAEWVREANLMPIGGPYQVQAINGLQYAVDELDGADKKLCALVKDDGYGDAYLEGVEFGADKLGLEVSTTQKFRDGDQVFTQQVSALRSDGCEVVMLSALPTESNPILTEANGSGFAPSWIGASPTWISAFGGGDLGPYLADNFYLVAEGPEWGDTSVAGMAQMLEDVEKYAPDQTPDIYFAFGYAQMWAAVQILEKAIELGDLSPQGVLKASTEVGTLTFEGLVGDYVYGTAEDRNPPRESTINKVDPSSVDTGYLVATVTNKASDAAKDYTFGS